MAHRPSSALILALLGLFSPESIQTAPDQTPFPKAPIPQVSATVSPVERLSEELAHATFGPTMSEGASNTEIPRADTPDIQSDPKSALARSVSGSVVALSPLGRGYHRLSRLEMGQAAQMQVEALAAAFKPKASGKQGIPIEWLPRETRKALASNGPRGVVLLAATPAFAWYVWAESDAAWIGCVDMEDPTKIQAGPLPTSGPFIVPGPQRLIYSPGEALKVLDSRDEIVPQITR
ncbi:hypothetical protein [Stomatohabitans albus]|uniref:hypothetical protein n=1 Tax=Stomatohabitans albus TaxID=3110766 RepID=UPI00300D43E1